MEGECVCVCVCVCERERERERERDIDNPSESIEFEGGRKVIEINKERVVVREEVKQRRH